MDWVLPPPPVASVAVVGTDARFAVRRIFCVGRNYAAHAREMGADPDRTLPCFFTKPADAVVDADASLAASIPYPPDTAELHHEVELAVAIGTGGATISRERALDHVFGYAVALDLTRRDRQREAKERRHPWDWGKAFDRSAPIAALHPARDVGHPEQGRIWLTVDGELRQQADLGELIWPVAEVVSLISRSIALAPGDLVLTGTPAGVGPIERGQTVRAGIDGLRELQLTVA